MYRLLILILIKQLFHINNVSCSLVINKNDTTKLLQHLFNPSMSINDWFAKVNEQYEFLSHLTASIAWDLR